MENNIHYITFQELIAVIGGLLTITGMVLGVIMAIMKNSINTKVFSMLNNSEAKMQNKISSQEEDLKEVKENYLDRFERINKLLMEMNVKLSEIKTSINYITEEQNRIRRKQGD